jgi:TPR repeat protein
MTTTADAELRWRIGFAHREGDSGRSLARWSGAALAAQWALSGIDTAPTGRTSLAASLNEGARGSLATIAAAPLFLPLAGLAVALFLTYGSFFRAGRLILADPRFTYKMDFQRSRMVITRTTEAGRGWRQWLILGWWAVAAAAGALVAVLTGAVLRHVGNQWLCWALVFAVAAAVARLDAFVTVDRYPERVERATGDERTAELVKLHIRSHLNTRRVRPQVGLEFLRIYSGRSRPDVASELGDLLTSRGPVAWVVQWLVLALTAILYGLVPAPSVDRFTGDGWLGRSFASFHDLAGMARDNLGAALVIGGVGLVLTPVALALAYRRLMAKYGIDRAKRYDLLRRLAPGLALSPVVLLPDLAVSAVTLAAVLWLSAVVAVGTSSPVLGIATLLAAGWVLTWSVKRFQRWVYTSGPLAGGSPDPTPEEAEARLRAAAGEGDAEAMYHLFLLMFQADRLAEAQEWNRRAAEAGHVVAMATYGALLADRGDEAGALDWYRRAAEAGHVDAAYNLGVALYDAGNGDEAAGWFAKAAEHRQVKAMGYLAVLASAGGDDAQAAVWLRRIAAADDPDAVRDLAADLLRSGHLAEALTVARIADSP